jgi:hypothetical protein
LNDIFFLFLVFFKRNQKRKMIFFFEKGDVPETYVVGKVIDINEIG